jgi:hypothetical protein
MNGLLARVIHTGGDLLQSCILLKNGVNHT